MNNKTIDDTIMKRIFDIEDGSYIIKTSIGDLIIEKLTFNNTNNVFYDKQVTVNISINNNKTLSTYFYKRKEYLDVGKYGFSRNTNEKYVIDRPEYELFNYKYDEKIKREIAEGLNNYSKKRIGIKEGIICDRSTQEGLLLNKLEKLNNGYYIIESPKGLIEIDINLYKDITISFNNETIFNIEYGTIQYISNSLMDIIEEINKKIDKELARQDKINEQNNKIERQNEIKRLEKRLRELKNNE